MHAERQENSLNIFGVLKHAKPQMIWYIISCGYEEKSSDFLQTNMVQLEEMKNSLDAAHRLVQANKIGAFF